MREEPRGYEGGRQGGDTGMREGGKGTQGDE